MQDAEKQLELLKRKITREQKARQLAESKLEGYSREIYIANQSLKSNLLQMNERQADLEFLHRTASAVNSSLSLHDLLEETVKLVGRYVSADIGTWVQCNEQGQVVGEAHQVWQKGDTWQTKDSDMSLFNDGSSYFHSFNETTQWIVTPLEEDEFLSQYFGTALYLNIPYTSTSLYNLAFICASEVIQPEMLFVLDTAKDHLFSGIKRRAAEHRILRRNQQLEKAVADLELAQTQLIQSEKMASLGQLAAGVAHEINNPIAYIRANLEVLKEYHQIFKACFNQVNDKLATDNLDTGWLLSVFKKHDISFLLKDSQNILSTNLKGIDRVKEIVDGLKTFAHAGDNKQVLMSLNQCIENTLQMVANEFKYQHTVENNLSIINAQIIGNKAQLQQVFVHLFVNAAAAMPDGGELRLLSHESSNSVEIIIADTGHGMTDETKQKIFTPFFTTKPVGSGTGLGLSISMAILEAHNVQIDVESRLNIGTEFRLVFPKVLNSHCR